MLVIKTASNVFLLVHTSAPTPSSPTSAPFPALGGNVNWNLKIMSAFRGVPYGVSIA